MVYDAISTLLMNLGLFGGGIAFGVIGLIFGAVRGMTKNSEMWAIGSSAFAWLIALMIPGVPWAMTVFILGAVGISLAFIPVIKKMEDSNIFAIAVISIIVNLLIIIGSGAMTLSFGWQSNIGIVQTDIANVIGDEVVAINGYYPTHGLCRPDDPECSTSALSGAYNSVLYDVFASVLAIGIYISKAIKLAGSVLFAPFVMAFYIIPYITNPIIYYLVAFSISLWNIAIVYKAIAFILNKRGMT